jgi:hypothetical protein
LAKAMLDNAMLNLKDVILKNGDGCAHLQSAFEVSQ